MLRLTEVASQSVTFVKPALRKAKTNTVNSINEMDGPSGHYPVVFSLDRPPLLAVMPPAIGREQRTNEEGGASPPRELHGASARTAGDVLQPVQ